MQSLAQSFSCYVKTPECQSALTAVQDIAAALLSKRARPRPNPLFLHGPPGCGKTHLVSALTQYISDERPELVIMELSASELAVSEPAISIANGATLSTHDQPLLFPKNDDKQEDDEQLFQDQFQVMASADLLVIEDLQFLPEKAMRPLSLMMDHMLNQQQQLVFTANTGPQLLRTRKKKRFPARLVSRLAGGLVVRMEPFGVPSRREILKEKAQALRLSLPPEILDWLAKHIGNTGREITGALHQVQMLAKVHKKKLNLEIVIDHFQQQGSHDDLTLDDISKEVCQYFQVDLQHLQSPRRFRNVTLPRQLCMYLARDLTPLSLDQIGDYFGGRDHTTVLHACRKINDSLDADSRLGGIVRQLKSVLR